MEYETALRLAQEQGFAEADPTSDVEGEDAAYKLSILILIATGFRTAAVKFSILLTCAWWAIFSIPMLRHVKQIHFTDKHR